MMVRLVWSVFIVLFLATSLLPSAAGGANFIETLKQGSIDWTNRIIEAIGESKYPKGSPKSRARSLAKNLAMQKARENLLSIILDIPMDSNRSVSHFITNDKGKLKRLILLIKRAEIADISFPEGNKARVTLSMKFNDDLAELILPEYIRKIKSITRTAACSKRPKDSHTGILIDCNGIDFKPCLIPRIVNEKKEEIFGPAYVSRECVSKEGMVKYVLAPDKRIKGLWLGPRVLSIQALRVVKDNPTIVVLTNSDAETLRGDPTNLSLFHDCKVVFVLGRVHSKIERNKR